MNEYDSGRIYDITKKINYKKTENLKEADCYILNTCHIREKATDKVYHDVGRIKKEFRDEKKPIVIITGCVAQAEGEILLKREKYIDAVIGPQSYHQINDVILNLEKNLNKINSTEFDVIEKFDTLNYVKNSDTNVSSFLTIQEGCDKFCKFCVVPYTRGVEYSRSIKDLVNEARQLIANGSPSEQIIVQKEYATYTTCRFHVQIHNTTDDEYSVFIVSSNSFGGNATFNIYNNLYTDDSEKRNMDNTSIHITSTQTQLKFLPVANKAYTIRTYELKIDKPDATANNVTITY